MGLKFYYVAKPTPTSLYSIGVHSLTRYKHKTPFTLRPDNTGDDNTAALDWTRTDPRNNVQLSGNYVNVCSIIHSRDPIFDKQGINRNWIDTNA